jgi:ATP-dependent DNA helicase PIF1
LDIILSAEQKTLSVLMEQTHQHLFITGRAGTGKSVLLRHFRENTKKRVVVAAPTGIAALNVRGQTIHSLFKLPPQLHRKGGLAPNSRVCSLLKRIDTLIIDEISMVRADLLDAVDERLREAFGNNLPFGGVQIVMFGDPYQLPPVVEEGLVQYFEAVHNGYFFFNALVWQKAEFKIYELTQVFRQKDPIFKNILNTVRDGTVVDEQIEQLNTRYGTAIPDEGTVTLAPTNALVTTINQQRLDQLKGKARQYTAVITGEMRKSVFPTEEILQLKKGAQIVLLKNDKDGRWVNGTVGMVDGLFDDQIKVRVGGIVYTLEQETWEEIAYTYDLGTQKVEMKVVSSFTQFPIRLAWALTIHKSQGQTYESVAIDLTTATFAAGQLYVALSRSISLEGLYLKMPIKRGHIIVEPKVAAFMSRRETIIVEAKEEPQIEVAVPIVAEVPLVMSRQDIFASSDESQQLLQQENTTPLKKRGRPRTGRTKENVTFSLDKSVIEFLSSLSNQSETVNDLLMQSKEYQHWMKAHAEF